VAGQTGVQWFSGKTTEEEHMDYAKLGFIGCGEHATGNLFPALRFTRSRLEGVCDLKPERAEFNARVFGAARWFTDVDKMLDECELDGMIIVGEPRKMHYEIGMKALKRGIHLMVEKPPAPDLSTYEEMCQAAKSKDLVLMTALMKLHGMAYAKVRQMIVSGQFRPASAYLHYGTWAPKANPEKPFGFTGDDFRYRSMLGMGIHIIGLAWHFFGKPVSITSCLSTTRETYYGIP
jgi:myo-inositol 2-dehydrogenase/D-chiro-inositol 1-dehydrogenase